MPIKTTILTLSKNEFIEKDGKLYHKIISERIIKGKVKDYEARAWDLYNTGKYAWREVADILNAEGYRTVQGNVITAHRLLKRWSYLKGKGSK